MTVHSQRLQIVSVTVNGALVTRPYRYIAYTRWLPFKWQRISDFKWTYKQAQSLYAMASDPLTPLQPLKTGTPEVCRSSLANPWQTYRRPRCTPTTDSLANPWQTYRRSHCTPTTDSLANPWQNYRRLHCTPTTDSLANPWQTYRRAHCTPTTDSITAGRRNFFVGFLFLFLLLLLLLFVNMVQ